MRKLNLPLFIVRIIVPACLLMALGCSTNDITLNNSKTKADSSQEDTIVLDDSIAYEGSIIPAHVDCDLGFIFTATDTIAFSDYPGTICCISGPTHAAPGDTLIFTYNSNIETLLGMNWGIDAGSLTLIAGQHAETVTFVCGPDFTGGTIWGWGNPPEVGDTPMACSDRVVITADNQQSSE